MKKKPQKILIIDDDPTIVRMIEKWLKESGRAVFTAFNAEVGLDLAGQEIPDLIVCDLMLPGMGGVDFSKRVKSNRDTRHIPIIFISVVVGVENDKGDETIEIDGCLYRIFAKPLHKAKLLSEIRKSINRRIHGDEDFYIRGS